MIAQVAQLPTTGTRHMMTRSGRNTECGDLARKQGAIYQNLMYLRGAEHIASRVSDIIVQMTTRGWR